MSNQPTVRNIRTVYSGVKGETLKINHASYANSAVLRAVDHMQLNNYGAKVAEVFDSSSGELHAVIRNSMNGEIRIVYEREVSKGM
jgi:hypothetical protein